MREAPAARKASETERLAQRESAAIAEQALRFALEVRERERLRVLLAVRAIAERVPFAEKEPARLRPRFEKKAERQRQSPMSI